MSLKCCGKLCQIIQSIPLYDTSKHTFRVLTVGRCKNSKCGCLKGEFTYYDKLKGRFVHQAIPSTEIADTIRRFKNDPSSSMYNTNIRYGTYGNMHWKYHKDGCIYDFNNVLLQKLQKDMVIYGSES